MEHILAAVDFSNSTADVISMVKKVAATFHSHVKIIHTVAPQPVLVSYYGAGGPLYFERAFEGGTVEDEKTLKILEHMLEEAGVDAESLFFEGPTVELILQAAEDFKADLIIAGAHKHGALYNFFVGSVSEQLVKKAPCPILIVPHREKDQEDFTPGNF